MTRKEMIIYLINEYKNGKYRTETFCDEFIRILYHEEDESITDEEYKVYSAYADVFSRFSPYDDDVISGSLFGEERIYEEFNKLWEATLH